MTYSHIFCKCIIYFIKTNFLKRIKIYLTFAGKVYRFNFALALD